MGFPAAVILDTATRADEGPPPSSSWSTPALLTGMSVVSNQFAGGGATNGAIWNTSYAADQVCYVTIPVLPAVASAISILVRGQQTGSAATIDGYIVTYTRAAGTDTCNIQRLDNAVGTTLGATISQEITAGDSIGIQVRGSTIEAFYRSGSGAWVSLGSRTDSTYTSSGNIGMIVQGTTARLTNFGGGVAACGPVMMVHHRQAFTA